MIFQGPACIYQGTLPRGIGKVPIPVGSKVTIEPLSLLITGKLFVIFWENGTLIGPKQPFLKLFFLNQYSNHVPSFR